MVNFRSRYEFEILLFIEHDFNRQQPMEFVSETEYFQATYKSKENDLEIVITTHDNLHDTETIISLLNKSYTNSIVVKLLDKNINQINEYKWVQQ